MPALENVEAYVKAEHRYRMARYLGGADREFGENNKEICDLLEPIIDYLMGRSAEEYFTNLTKQTNVAAKEEEKLNLENPYDMDE